MPEFEMSHELQVEYFELQDIFAALDEELAQQAFNFTDEDLRLTEKDLFDLVQEWGVARSKLYEFAKDAFQHEYPDGLPGDEVE